MMCGDDYDHNHETSRLPSRPSRRLVLGAAAAGAAALTLPVGHATAAATRLPNLVGESWYRAAMHLHGSFSEGNSSWMQHFYQASLNGFDIVNPTEHDWRVLMRHYGGAYHFTGWTEPTASGYWQLIRRVASLNLATTSAATLVADPAPADPLAGAGALQFSVSSTNRKAATVSYEVSTDSSGDDIKGTVLGRQLHVQVLTSSATSPTSYPFLQLTIARDPRYGLKTITYRLRNDITGPLSPTFTSNTTGVTAILDYPVVGGVWSEFAPSVVDDIRRCWPDLVAEDHSMSAFVLGGAGSKASPLLASFSYLHLDADSSYDAAASLDSVIAATSAAYPGLLVPVGLEHSVDHHFGQIGGRRFFYPYAETDASTHSNFGDAVAFDQVAKILDNGGVSCYNHPFGAGSTLPSAAKRTSLLNSTITSVLATNAYNADTIELGYSKRGMDLAGHLELGDSLSANLRLITAVGVSDDHNGQSWSTQSNRFTTLPWMRGLDEASLQAALRGGRVAVAQLGTFDGSLDLSINNNARMGQALVAPQSTTDTLVVECSNPPTGSSLLVRSGPVDMGGSSFTRPTLLATISSSNFGAGPVSVPLPSAVPAYYRVELVDSTGLTIAFTNPIWRLSDPTGVPANRLVLG